jgi:hypothetical protein
VYIRLGNWLTAEPAKALLHAPDIEKVRGKRDHGITERSCGALSRSLQPVWASSNWLLTTSGVPGHDFATWPVESLSEFDSY